MSDKHERAGTPRFPREDSKPWYKHRWPWFLMIGPVAVMIGTGVSAYLGSQTPVAMVVDDYYKQGKAINQDLRRDRVATDLDLRFEVSHDVAAGRLNGQLASGGKPVVAPFHIQFAHPTQPEKDLVLEAVPNGEGRFSTELPVLEATHWQVVVEGGSRDWRLARSWSPAKEAVLVIDADPR